MQKHARKNNKGRTKGPNRGMTPRKIERMDHPPQIDNYQVTHSKRLRFTVKAGTSTTITFQNLLDCMIVATTAIQGYDLFEFVRIGEIEVWGIAAIGTPSTVEVNFITATGDADIHTDTSLGVKPAYIKAKPAKRSLASFFNLTTAGNAFSITAPTGSIIDIGLTFRSSTLAPQAAQNALVGASIGEFYWRGLDGLSTSATNFPPPNGVQTV